MTDKKSTPPSAAKPTPPASFDPVEAALRQMFDDVASEDVPEDFAGLVAELAKKAREAKEK